MSDKDVDAQFADIVAHWDEVALPPQERLEGYAGASPTEEALDVPDGTAVPDASVRPEAPAAREAPEAAESTEATEAADTTRTQEGFGRGVNPPPELGFVVWRGATTPEAREESGADVPREYREAEDDDDHFHPGPTAPLPPQEDIHFWGIIVGLVVGPLLLLWLVIFRPAVSGWWTVGALGLTVAGFVLLVMRQPSTHEGDDPDDGARI
jgi:hypothetical protein